MNGALGFDAADQRPREQAVAAASFIQRRWTQRPRVAIVLGSGLGGLARTIRAQSVISFDEIPHFRQTTALSHSGQLVCGELHGVEVVALQGRCHCYEGYSFHDITLPVRTVSRLGAQLLIISNASGGLNPQFNVGDIMLIADHINLLGARTAVGHSQALLLPARTTSPSLYDPSLIELSAETARIGGFQTHRGVYAAVTGPSYETRAEYRAFRRLGADAVGMSTVPEVLAAARAGMKILGLSTITNVARPDAPQKTDARQVIDAAAQTEPQLRQIVERVVLSWRSSCDPSGDEQLKGC